MSEQRFFLDMCILIFYASNTQDIKDIKTREFVKNKSDKKFLLCYYIADRDMPNWLSRQKEIIQKIKEIYSSGDYLKPDKLIINGFFQQDKNKIKKIITQLKISRDKEGFIKRYGKNIILIEKHLNYFLGKLIDEKVIPLEEIDQELKSSLLTYLEGNVSDANILASGIQEHKNKEVVLLTGDKQHWTKDNLEWAVPNHPNLNKRYKKIPEIKYVQDM